MVLLVGLTRFVFGAEERRLYENSNPKSFGIRHPLHDHKMPRFNIGMTLKRDLKTVTGIYPPALTVTSTLMVGLSRVGI